MTDSDNFASYTIAIKLIWLSDAGRPITGAGTDLTTPSGEQQGVFYSPELAIYTAASYTRINRRNGHGGSGMGEGSSGVQMACMNG
jgi:hypothetical protein